MTEKIDLNIRCPQCGERLVKSRFASKGNWVTHWRIKCSNSQCEVDTGEQCTMSDVYEAFMFLYFGAESSKEYVRNIPEQKGDV